jgi:hypothetical protein
LRRSARELTDEDRAELASYQRGLIAAGVTESDFGVAD